MTAKINGSDLRKKPKHSQCDSDESLDEFLDHEVLCFLQEDNLIGEAVSVVDLDKELFLNELENVENDPDSRSVDDILHEAELLMHKQPTFSESSEEKCSAYVSAPRQKNHSEVTIVKMLSGLLNDPNFPTGDEPNGRHQNGRHRQDKKPKKLKPSAAQHETLGAESTFNEKQQKRSAIKPSIDEAAIVDKSYYGVQANTNTMNSPNREENCFEFDQPAKIEYAQHHVAASTTCNHDELPSVENGERVKEKGTDTLCTRLDQGRASSRKQLATQFCDRATQPSPIDDQLQLMSLDGEADRFTSWSQERALEGKISDLQEQLKDTEERYQSLKLQYDTLSQVHRTLRENYNVMQEESEKMQFDIQHLTKCTNLLRAELQSARCDRDSAIELQRMLQSDLDDSRKEKKRLQDSTEKDTKTIQDLQRQCREMERILMRKNPDSISALIVASKSASGKPDGDSTSSTCRLLEQRIAQLEADARKQDAKAQGILADVQARFNSVQAKYETHIADLEMQVLSLQEINSKLNEKIIRQMEELASISSHAAVNTAAGSQSKNSTAANCTQTEVLPEQLATEPPAQQIKLDSTRTRSILVQTDVEHPPSGRNHYHQQQQMATKRAQAQGKEDAHLLATIRGMRVDLAIKEKAVQRLTREVDECKKTIKKIQKKKEGPTGRGDSGRSPVKVRNKASESMEPDAICSLRETHEKIKTLEMDYKALQEKRLLDLKTLQAAHEKELASCHESIRIMQQRLNESEEELVHRKDKHRPNHSNDYYGLKAKVAYLERRHTEREQRLLMLVEALSK